jgi:uncharacterized FlaG/YvyC family protein
MDGTIVVGNLQGRLVPEALKPILRDPSIGKPEAERLHLIPGAPAGADTQKPATQEEILRETDFANAVVALFDEKLSFSYDDRIDRVIVKIVDGTTEEVIRQFPPEEMIKLHAALKDGFRGLIFNKAG